MNMQVRPENLGGDGGQPTPSPLAAREGWKGAEIGSRCPAGQGPTGRRLSAAKRGLSGEVTGVALIGSYRLQNIFYLQCDFV